MKNNSNSILLCIILLSQYSECDENNNNNLKKSHISIAKNIFGNSQEYFSSHHKIRHHKIRPQIEAYFELRDKVPSSTENPTKIQHKPVNIRYKQTPTIHRKRTKHFRLNYSAENDRLSKTLSSHSVTPKTFENVMNIELDLTVSKSNAKSLAKERILDDKDNILCRRRRYTVPYGFYTNLESYVPCTGWSSYGPHGCVSKCSSSCPNPCRRYPKPLTYTPVPIYRGAAKDWYGPKYGCNCNPKGSELTTCDIKTGHCRCKLNYVGRTCDKCESGYWENAYGCIICDCNPEGSRSFTCEHATGRCYCKEGVGGDKCNSCLDSYYGFSKDGCKKCDDCKKPGHICDPKTGRCVCPTNSHGVYCEKCLTNTWGHEPEIGCKECNCSKFGTKRQECNLKTGQCFCDVAYSGQNCDQCAIGYYGYPKCRPCNCNIAGTRCSANLCQCDENGQCPCKKNAIGRTCNTCKEETFGLDTSNPNGCTECFCFNRSKKCLNAPYIWDQIPSHQIISETLYRKKNSLYWKLPHVFNGDRLLSYNGYLRFKIETRSNDLPTGRHDPLIILEGNRMEIYRFQLLPQIAQKYEVHIQEDMWRTPTNAKVSRMDFMIILQNITDIFIKAADSHTSDNSILVSVTLDTATEARGTQYRPAIGIEMCECPTQYTSTSCQTPSPGYCRKRTHHAPLFGKVNIDYLIGRSLPCECNGRSRACDSETCRCQNCTNNTDGSKCEICKEGYFGDPNNCWPCPCPTKDKNFAIGCDVKLGVCICKPGYVGPKCATCAQGYYGNPMEDNGSCKPCDCNPQGVFRSGCDSSGQCYCKVGIIGKKCSLCEEARHILQNNVCVPCDDCTQKLLDQVEKMKNALHGNTSHLLQGKLEPPWGELEKTERKHADVAERFKIYVAENDKAKKLIGDMTTSDHYNDLEKIRTEFDLKKLKVDVLVKDIVNTNNQTLNAANELAHIKFDVEDYTDSLNSFGTNYISTREAVHEGETILKHMQHQHKKVQKMDVNGTLAKCTAINNFLETISENNQMDQLVILNDNLNDITDFLESMDKLLLNTSKTVKHVENKNVQNEDRLKRLREVLLKNANKAEMVEAELKSTNDNIKKVNKAINETEALIVKVIDEGLENVVNDLEKRQKDLTTAIRVLKEKFNDAKNHTNMLHLKVKNIEKIFEKDDKQVSAEKASEAFSNIVTLLKEANETAVQAHKVLNDLKDQVEPKGMDSLSNKIFMLSANASQLESRILFILNHRAPDTKDRMTKIENRLNEIKNKNWYNGIKLNKLIDEPLPDHDNVNVKKIINDALATSDQMKEIYKEAAHIKNVRIPYDLRKNLDKLKSLTTITETEEIRKKINEARNKVQSLLKNFIEIKFNKETGIFHLENKNITLKLEELKAKIKKSKAIADGIRVSLSGEFCTRSYKLNNLEPSLVTNLKIKFSRNSTYSGKQTSLFYLSNNEGQFMNLVATKDSIVFFLKLSPTEKENKLVIDTSEEECNINVERMFNIIRITVNNKVDQNLIKNGNVRFNINSANLIQVGNAPDLKGLPGCIHDVTFNGKKIGLWQFEQTDQCEGCSRSITISSTPTYRFNGEGFSMIKDTRNVNPLKFGINFWFKTFDENALLFLSPHHESGSFLALTLHDGHIQYEVHYNRNEMKPIVLRTRNKYNDGIKYNVDVVKYFDRNVETSKLVVDKEELTEDSYIERRQLLKIKKTNLYVGGVSPDYFLNPNNTTGSLHTHISFLGDIENFKLTQFIMLHETSKSQHQYGVQFTDKPLEFRKIWLEGAGYLKLKPQQFKPTFSLIFVIRTTDNNSFIISVDTVAAFVIRDGYLNVNIGDKALYSKEKLNDDEYHVVELIKRSSQTYVLKIDSVRADKQEILKQTTLDNGVNMPIFIGGIPKVTSPNEYFNGEISDIFLDKAEQFRLLNFSVNTIEEFDHVKIGRNKPKRPVLRENDETINENLKPRTLTDSENIKDQQSIEGCDKNVNNSLELNAAKFGDMSESYVKYYLKEQFWKEDFSIELDFRTFYKSGLLLFAQSDMKHYNLIELKEGSIVLHVVGKRKKMLQLSKRLDDGDWHKLIIENKSKKRKRKLTITVDSKREKPKRIPQNKVGGDVFIGGIPQNVHQRLPKQLISKITPFKGCIKELKINQAPQSFLHHHQIGLCFSSIERGSYFSGDAYAIYDRYFRVTSFLEIKFEFKTREQNGILMSVSTVNNSPALSLELQNGAVVMSVDMGNGVVSNVTNYHSAYALCDNRWHNVTALFSTELTVNVDGVSKSWVISEMGLMDEMEDPLYIGGLPDIAPTGTLKIRENFKGCIRNIKIGDDYVDWVDMEELINVSLNSCPAS